MIEENEGGGGHESSERWLVSYADFITLLFALFVLLYALSNSNHVDQTRAMDSVKRAVGVHPRARRHAARPGRFRPFDHRRNRTPGGGAGAGDDRAAELSEFRNHR